VLEKQALEKRAPGMVVPAELLPWVLVFLRLVRLELGWVAWRGPIEWPSDEISVDEVTSQFVLSLGSWREKITRYCKAAIR